MPCVCVCVCSWCEWTWAISFLPQCLLTKPSRTLSHSAQSAVSVSFISFSLSLLLLPLLSHPHPVPPPPNVCLHPGSPRAPGAAWRDWPRWSQGLCVECFELVIMLMACYSPAAWLFSARSDVAPFLSSWCSRGEKRIFLSRSQTVWNQCVDVSE